MFVISKIEADHTCSASQTKLCSEKYVQGVVIKSRKTQITSTYPNL